jgi:bacteriorhodopsin
MEAITVPQFEFIYNVLSFSIATMGAATLFFWLARGQVAPQFRLALIVSGLVTFIATYHYFRIFESWNGAYAVQGNILVAGPKRFNDAYRYVDWLLTVPLLLVELILVMGLTRADTISKGLRLGLLAALMVALGYPGEIAGSMSSRVLWGGISMIPFLFILYELFVGLRGSLAGQPPAARGLVNAAIWVTLASWSFYPVVYFAPIFFGPENANLNTMSGSAITLVQTGYTIADILAKAAFGVLIFLIASAKSTEWNERQRQAELALVR